MKKIIDIMIQDKRKIICVIFLVMIGLLGMFMLNNETKKLCLTSTVVEVELGQRVSTDLKDYLAMDKIKDFNDIIKYAKEEDDLQYAILVNKDEQGHVISKERKGYPEVGNYKINFIYNNERATVKVIVKDTKNPQIIAPECIEISRYTHLSTFNFENFLQVFDYSEVKNWKIDFSKVDTNILGVYDLKVAIQDKYKNKAEKKIKVSVIEQKLNVDKKEVDISKDEPSKSLKNKVNIKENIQKEVVSKEEIKNNDSTSNDSINNIDNLLDSKNEGNTEQIDKHIHNYNIPIIEKVHHDAVVDNQPIYETHIVCKVCGKDFGKYGGMDGDDHSIETGHSYHSTAIQVGVKQITLIKEYDEDKVIGYRCLCGKIK